MGEPMAKKSSSPAVTARLREAILASGLSLSELGRQAGLDHARLSRFVRGERDLTLDSVDKLCRVLGLQLVNAEADATGGAKAEARAEVIRPAAASGPPKKATRGRKGE